MDIKITGRNITITPSVKKSVENALKRLETAFPPTQSVGVTFENAVGGFKVNIQYKTDGHPLTNSSAKNLIFSTCVREAADKIERQLKSGKSIAKSSQSLRRRTKADNRHNGVQSKPAINPDDNVNSGFAE